ncbi:MAG: hypothetical protein M3O22_01395 [Pseudomonadota bacterium]|nr:hypothetical protein [Pseudomonadota bacterium]
MGITGKSRTGSTTRTKQDIEGHPCTITDYSAPNTGGMLHKITFSFASEKAWHLANNETGQPDIFLAEMSVEYRTGSPQRPVTVRFFPVIKQDPDLVMERLKSFLKEAGYKYPVREGQSVIPGGGASMALLQIDNVALAIDALEKAGFPEILTDRLRAFERKRKPPAPGPASGTSGPGAGGPPVTPTP